MEIKGRWMITFFLTVFLLVFFNAWSNESQEKQESVIDYSKVIEIEGRRFVVRGEDVQDPIRRILAYPPIEEGRLTRAQIEKLAREFGLLDETETNPHLRFLDGDIAYWYEQE